MFLCLQGTCCTTVSRLRNGRSQQNSPTDYKAPCWTTWLQTTELPAAPHSYQYSVRTRQCHTTTMLLQWINTGVILFTQWKLWLHAITPIVTTDMILPIYCQAKQLYWPYPQLCPWHLSRAITSGQYHSEIGATGFYGLWSMQTEIYARCNIVHPMEM